MQTAIQLLDKISVGSMILDSDYNVLFWNQVMENWTGIKKTEIVGQKISETYPQFEKPELQSRLHSVFSYGTPVIFSSQIHKYIIHCALPNDRFRYQQTLVTAIRSDHDPKEYYALFSIQDVTDITEKITQYKEVVKLANDRNLELEKSKALIQASEANFRNMVEFSKDAIVIMQNNRFVFYNASLLNMLECDNDTIQTRDFESIQTGNVLSYLKLFAELEEKESVSHDLKFQKKDGEFLYINGLFKKTIFENAGSIIAIFRDITNHMEILEALRQNLKNTTEHGEILTICSSCHHIKDNHDENHKWIKTEKYLAKYVENTEISHGLCDACFEKYYPKEYEKYKDQIDSVDKKQKK